MQQITSEEDQLTQLSEQDPVTRSICQYFGTRERLRDVKVERIVHALEEVAQSEGTEPPGYYDVVRALKKIAAASASEKFGKFLAGRKGHDSRYKLTQAIMDFGSRLQPPEDFTFVSEEDEDEEEAEGEAETTEWLEHTIRIRDGLPIMLKLPKDLTQQEAKKLAGIIENLYA